MVACTVSYAYSTDMLLLDDPVCLVPLFPWLSGIASVSKSHPERQIPNLSWSESGSVTFHYEKLDEFIGCWAEGDRCVTMEGVVKNDVMEEAVGGVVPHCLWDGVNDDLLFSGKKVPDWPQRSLSLRQACLGATSWARDQILGRSVEHATKPCKHFTPFQYVYNHLIYSLPPPSIRADLFLLISALPRVR